MIRFGTGFGVDAVFFTRFHARPLFGNHRLSPDAGNGGARTTGDVVWASAGEAPASSSRALGQSVVAADGRTVQPSDVLGPDRAGRKMAISGDTRPCAALAAAAKEAGAKRLVLTHLPSRHDTDPSKLLVQAKEEFGGQVEVAYDGLTIELPAP
jgi:ribonuclease BN (tRNA processing enzyme)